MIAPEALKSMVGQINEKYIPIGTEHDPRIPPQGRLISSKLIRLDDGAYAVEGVAEIFEKDDEIGKIDNSRQMPLKTYNIDTYGIRYDQTYKDSESQKIINDIAYLLNASIQEEIKKAFEPISILTIVGAFILGAVAHGFLNKLGADAWDALKEKIKQLQRKKKGQVKERLLIYEFTLINEDTKTIAEIILANPTDEDIDSFFNSGLKQLDELVPKYFAPHLGLSKIVFGYFNKKLIMQFGVRKDAVPIYPNSKLLQLNDNG